MKDLLLSNSDTLERVKQSLFTKLGYVVNVTKIKVPVPPTNMAEQSLELGMTNA